MNTSIRDAVTAVLICEGQVYLMQRQPQLPAFAGYHAFPGGKVDKDEASEAFTHGLATPHTPRLLRALMRELREEVGFDLEAALADGDVCAIHDLGLAVTPAFVPTRFATHFFRIDLRHQPTFELDTREHASGEWATPAEWWQRYERGALLLAPPTRVTLAALRDDPECTRIDTLAVDGGLDPIPNFASVYGVRQFFVRSNTLPPAEHTNCFLIGDEGGARVLVDPSPADEAECERLCALVADEQVTEIFLTHHHPDHHQFAEVIARRLGVPIGTSADTHTRIARKSPKFFDGLEHRVHHDGETVTQWLGQPVRVVAVPGHDEGQLALMPDGRAWFIVGDLIQGIGTVVIAAPEGDMAKYFATLEKVIALKPRVIYPSHGPALGGTHYLELTLTHRRMREAQIKTLIESGKTIDESLAEVYKGVDPRLLPLARMNIESHLTKLRAEGALMT